MTLPRKPLLWPAGWKRCERRATARFDMPYVRAVDHVGFELRMLGATDVILTHGKVDGKDPGVALYFTLNGKRKVLACDQWDELRDNVRAIGRTLEAIRGIERWGASDMLERAFTGFDALPPPRSCWDVLGVAQGSSRDIIEGAYRTRARMLHPDRGGSNEAMAELNRARLDALNQCA